MFYKDRIEKIFELSSEKNKKNREENLEDLNRYKEEIHLEKGDFLSMVLGAYYTFLPLFLVLLFILYLTRPWQ